MSKAILSSFTSDCQPQKLEILGKRETPNHPQAECIFSVVVGCLIINELQLRRTKDGTLSVVYPNVRVQTPSGHHTCPAIYFETGNDRRRFNDAVIAALVAQEV